MKVMFGPIASARHIEKSTSPPTDNARLVFGEFGRLGNVMPPLVESGLAFTRLGLTASAFYGEGGVRLVAAPHSAVTPYVEGSAGVDTRDPMFGAGGGILLQGGPLRFDLGYRYKYVQANTALSSIFSVGQKMQSHQIRFGVGVRC